MEVRPQIAGEWYPKDPAALERTLDELLARAPAAQVDPASIRGLIAPHAGYRYSGAVAAHVFAAIEGIRPETVIILAPLHSPHPEPLLTSGFDAYQTPLGNVPIDRDAIDRLDRALTGSFGRGLVPVREASEHSIEVELPFLQRISGDFRIVPIMFAQHTEPAARAVAEALVAAFGAEPPLLLASSDLSHYFPQPIAEQQDAELLRRVVRLDASAVLRAQEQGAGQACGQAAIAAALWAVSAGEDGRGPARARVLRYATSGDVTGDRRSVVGYAAVCLYRERTSGGAAPDGADP